MACDPEMLRHVLLFILLDDEESAVLAGQVNLRRFAPRQRTYKIGNQGIRAYVVAPVKVQVASVDEDNQEVVMEEATHGDFFGFASVIEQTCHLFDFASRVQSIHQACNPRTGGPCQGDNTERQKAAPSMCEIQDGLDHNVSRGGRKVLNDP